MNDVVSYTLEPLGDNSRFHLMSEHLRNPPSHPTPGKITPHELITATCRVVTERSGYVMPTEPLAVARALQEAIRLLGVPEGEHRGRLMMVGAETLAPLFPKALKKENVWTRNYAVLESNFKGIKEMAAHLSKALP